MALWTIHSFKIFLFLHRYVATTSCTFAIVCWWAKLACHSWWLRISFVMRLGSAAKAMRNCISPAIRRWVRLFIATILRFYRSVISMCTILNGFVFQRKQPGRRKAWTDVQRLMIETACASTCEVQKQLYIWHSMQVVRHIRKGDLDGVLSVSAVEFV